MTAARFTPEIWESMRNPSDFRDRYARAREEQADKLFREIIEIADDASGDYVTTSDGKRIVDHENIQRSRLRVDARKWAAARLAPKKYGDRISHDVKGPGPNFQPAILITVDGQPHDELRTAEQRGRLGSEVRGRLCLWMALRLASEGRSPEAIADHLRGSAERRCARISGNATRQKRKGGRKPPQFRPR
jgi:hypothetical protein